MMPNEHAADGQMSVPVSSTRSRTRSPCRPKPCRPRRSTRPTGRRPSLVRERARVEPAAGSSRCSTRSPASGCESQRNAGRQLELVKTRLATFLDESGASKDVARELVDLRSALDRINPELEQRSLWGRTFGALPFMRDNAMVRALKQDRPSLRAGVEADHRHRDEAARGSHAARPRQRRAPPALRGRRGPAGGDPAPGVPRASCSSTTSTHCSTRPTTRSSATGSRRPSTTSRPGCRTCTRCRRSTSSTS